MDVEQFLQQVQAEPGYADQIQSWHRIPAREADWAELAPPLPPALSGALARQGIERLYTHQAAAVTAARAGRDVVVVTGTASGKTLCFNLPVLERVLTHRRSRALYLFPLKALAQDQLRKIEALGLWQQVRAGTYDADTPKEQRRAIRAEAHLVLTNPDMLHVGILPNHNLWSHFLAQLEFIVLDELHMYRGVFGSHTALVVRRLLRLCERYGAHPTLIACSATIANPGELAARLTGRDCTVIDTDGAPAGPRHVVVWNPPLLDPTTGQRRSGSGEAARLLAGLVGDGQRVLAFTTARQEAERLLARLRRVLDHDHPERVEQVAAYRAGYLAADRRATEQALVDGRLRAVVSTVALEAGIDIGGLDAAVIVGYPGTVASFRQQAGRAGRGRRPALAVLVCRASLIDQYVAHHPALLWSAPVEEARCDPTNPYILGDHLLCATAELPLTPADAAHFGPAAADILPILADEGFLSGRGGQWFYTGPPHPAGDVNLRSAGSGGYALIDSRDGALLGTVDNARLWTECHPGAIYLHQGEAYRVAGHHDAEHQVWLEPVDGHEMTRPLIAAEVQIEGVDAEQTLGWVTVTSGPVTATVTTVGYQRLRPGGFELLATEPLDGPPQPLETTALWLTFAPEVTEFVAAHGDLLAGLGGVQNAVAAVLPLLAMCDPRDLQGSAVAEHPQLHQPAIFIWDDYPGGIGLTERGYAAAADLLSRAHDAVEQCPCEAGCPACIQSAHHPWANLLLDKALTRILLRAAIGRDFTALPDITPPDLTPPA